MLTQMSGLIVQAGIWRVFTDMRRDRGEALEDVLRITPKTSSSARSIFLIVLGPIPCAVL